MDQGQSRGYVLALWISGLSDKSSSGRFEEGLAVFGEGGYRSYASVFEDGILDVVFDVSSRADAERLRGAVDSLCRRLGRARIEAGWVFPCSQAGAPGSPI